MSYPAYLFIFTSLIASPFIHDIPQWQRVPTRVAVICPVKLTAPNLNTLCEPLEEHTLYPFV